MDESPVSAAPARSAPPRTPGPAQRDRGRARLAARIYPFRVLGMGLAGIPVAVVLLERQAAWPAWWWAAAATLAWPQFARLRAARSRDPYRCEIGNLLIDSALAGSLAALSHFNLLPSALMLTLATVDKIGSGVPGLWRRSLPWMCGGLLSTAAATGFALQPTTSMPVIVACLPLMIIHTIGVSLAGQRLVREIRRKNRQLDLLSRTDGLTGLASRRPWQQHADAVLAQARERGSAAALLMIDIDRFKDVNDRIGHAAGDEILRALGAILLRLQGGNGLAGRYGGDEFALVVRDLSPQAALALAERIRAAAAADAGASVSVGVASAGAGYRSLRDWIEAADGALYRAKAGGRDRVERAPDA